MTHGRVIFSGKSGEDFHFQVWPLGTRFKALGAVYFVTRRAYDNSTYRRACHDGIYIGHTENLAEALAAHSQAERFKKFGANCVCVLPLADEGRRIAVEQDLLAAHDTHCNHEARAARIFDVPA
ncbi:MAG TPA: hypothetical protein VFP00_02350 [Burkholderiales bacterium]|nr:hypothetical protein [Burkholderiales bacterium]